jgi:hypothetical protein
MKLTSLLPVIVVCSMICDSLPAQNAPGAAPAPAGPAAQGAAAPAAPAAPATVPARREVVIPKGFRVLSINGRRVLCEPADEAWITTAMTKVQPSSKPATLPATLLQRLTANRSALLSQIAVDLALSDLTEPARLYDKELVAPIRALDALRPPVFFLVTTTDRIAKVMQEGWSDPHFYYNRAADAVSFNPTGVLATDRPMDDVVFPAVYDAKETPEKRAEGLALAIGSTEASVAASIEIRSRTLVGAVFAAIVNDNGMMPLKLREDQAWFGLGAASILSAKYAAVISQEPRAELVKLLTYEHPANPLKTTAIDLLHPTDMNTMRQDALPSYYDTVRRKSGQAVQFIVEQAGDAAIPKCIIAIRDKKPADGAALVKVVKDATGVDVTAKLSKGI